MLRLPFSFIALKPRVNWNATAKSARWSGNGKDKQTPLSLFQMGTKDVATARKTFLQIQTSFILLLLEGDWTLFAEFVGASK
jgi:hypothetical protein